MKNVKMRDIWIAMIFGFCALAGLPMLFSAHRANQRVNDMDRLRRISQAGMMYREAHGEVPFNLGTLVSSRMLIPGALELETDPYPEGFQNYYQLHYRWDMDDHERRSILGISDINAFGPYLPKLLERKNAGWAVAPATSVVDTLVSDFPMVYFRLQTDGSIKRYQTPLHVTKGVYGERITTLDHNDFFGETL